jgi:3-dehydroquinate synthase
MLKIMKYALITDSTVEELYGKALYSYLRELGYDVQIFSFPAGEGSKTRTTKEKLEDQLLLAGYGRETTIIALGGGVVTDLAGFLASTFCRGVPLVLIPTTLLGMVDAAIGGKTGVNTEQGKNMIGSFYFPETLVIDAFFLKTLPEKEMFNGTVEMLKAGLIADAEFFENFSNIPMGEAIHRSIEIKRRIVAQDPQETGLRRILNLGHTIGHAIETLSHYEISHGEAVAAGIVLEAQIGYELGILKASAFEKISRNFPQVPFNFDPEKLLSILCRDKKALGRRPRFVFLKDIGVPLNYDGNYCQEVAPELITQVLHDRASVSVRNLINA